MWCRKAVPEKGRNTGFQGGTELLQLQTHIFKAIWEISQLLSVKPAAEITAGLESAAWTVLPSLRMTSWALFTAPYFEDDDLWAWTWESPLQNIEHFHNFHVDLPFIVIPRGSHPQGLAQGQFFLPPLSNCLNDLARGKLGQEEGLFPYTVKFSAPLWVFGKAIYDTFHA